MNNDSGESMEAIEEVPLIGLGMNKTRFGMEFCQRHLSLLISIRLWFFILSFCDMKCW